MKAKDIQVNIKSVINDVTLRVLKLDPANKETLELTIKPKSLQTIVVVVKNIQNTEI